METLKRDLYYLQNSTLSLIMQNSIKDNDIEEVDKSSLEKNLQDLFNSTVEALVEQIQNYKCKYIPMQVVFELCLTCVCVYLSVCVIGHCYQVKYVSLSDAPRNPD